LVLDFSRARILSVFGKIQRATTQRSTYEDEESDSEDGEATVDDGDSTDVGGCEISTDVDEAGVDDDGSTEVEEAISDEVAAVVREMVVVDCGTGVPEDCATTVVVEGAEGDGLFVSCRHCRSNKTHFPSIGSQPSCLPR
jgi:hypothetical protein